jgi:glutathionyl-hydroquinone reductase
LYPTIIRYDSVYTTLFRCSRRRISDYPALARWRKDVFNLHVPAASMQVRVYVHRAMVVQRQGLNAVGLHCCCYVCFRQPESSSTALLYSRHD